MNIRKPEIKDLEDIREIFRQWFFDSITKKVLEDDVEINISRIVDEINGCGDNQKYNLHFWVAEDEKKVIGITGLCDPLPKILMFCKTENPGELKILYIDGKMRGKGVGTILLQKVVEEAKMYGYKELILRSAEIYREVGWGFYDKMGFDRVGVVTGGDESKKMQVFWKSL